MWRGQTHKQIYMYVLYGIYIVYGMTIMCVVKLIVFTYTMP